MLSPMWLYAVCSTLVIAAHVHAAAVPSQGTFVVARSKREVTETSDATTEEPNAPIKLTEMRVNSEISLRYAHTAIVTHVRNPARRAQQATFHVLLPETAFISGFVMTLSGKSYHAYVKEKEEAKKLYSDAVSQGVSAAHVSAKARDSNHFTVSVNLEANSVAVFNLTYEELLVRHNNMYKHAINLHPGTLVPNLEVTVVIKESQKISLLRIPEIRTGNEIDSNEDNTVNSKAVIQKSNNEKEATITFRPNLEEQIRLARIYKEKTRESLSSSHNWYSHQSDVDSSTGNLGQFVVLYDVERPEKGEILVNDGYFVHFFAPPVLKPLSKHVVFVLDTSGSMGGTKINQLKEAMRTILNDLHPSDYFSIVEFNSNVKVYKLSEAETPENSINYWGSGKLQGQLNPPSIASPENIAKAQIIVSRLGVTGGTCISKALEVAVDLTDKKIETIQSSSASNDTKMDNVELQPIIIFLTDGSANMCGSDTNTIVSSITEKNSGAKKAAIYSLAFGQYADRGLLQKLSLRNEGFMRHIYEAADAAIQLQHFYNQISSPLLANVNFVYPPGQVKEGSLTQSKFKTVFLGSEVVLAGEIAPGAIELTPQLLAISAAETDDGLTRYEVANRVDVLEKKEYFPLERLWAYLTIKQLLDERDANKQKNDNNPTQRALDIALKYGFVTPLTSLVVVKPNATDAVEAESVDRASIQAPITPPVPSHTIAGHTHSSLAGGHRYPMRNSASDYNNGARSSFSSNRHSMISNIGNGQNNRNYLRISGFGDYDYDSAGSGFYPRSGQPSVNGYNSLSQRHPDINLHILGGSSYPDSDDENYRINGYSDMSFGRSDSNLRIGGATYGGISDDSDLRNHHGSRVLGGSMDLSPFLSPIYGQPPTVTSTPQPTTTDFPSTTESLQDTYHLKDYSWALSVLNRNTSLLEFKSNGTNVSLELSTSVVPPKESLDSECVKSVSDVSQAGVCVYLTRCAAAKTLTPERYGDVYCVVDNKYAGVCCPTSEVDSVAA